VTARPRLGVLAAVVGLGLVGAAPTVVAQVPPAPGVVTPAQVVPGPVTVVPENLRLTEISPSVSPVDVLRLGFATDGLPEGATITLELHGAVANRIRFGESLAGKNLRSVLRTYDDLAVDALPRDDRGAVRLDLEIVDSGAPPIAGFQIDAEGVYPLVLTAHDRDGVEIDQLIAHVVRLPATDPDNEDVPLDVALVVPLDAPSSSSPTGAQELDDEAAADLERAVSALAASPDVAATVDPSPTALAALAARSDGTGAVVTAELDGALDGRQLLTTTYAPLAYGSWVAAALTDEVVWQLDAGTAALDAQFTATARRGTWVMDPTIDPEALGALRRMGVDQVVVPEQQLIALDSRQFPVTLTRPFELRTPDGNVVPATMADQQLGDLFVSSDQPALAANRVLADLAVLAFDEPGAERGTTVLVPGEGATPRALAPVLRGLGEVPTAGGTSIFRPVTVDDLLARVDPALASGDQDDEGEPVLQRGWTWDVPTSLGEHPSELAAANELLANYRSMLPTDADETTRQAERLLLDSSDRRLAAPEQTALVDGATTLVAARTSAVALPSQGTVTLTSDVGSIPVVLENNADSPLQVRIDLSSEKLEFPGGESVDALLQPGSNRIEVEVRTRASGAFRVEMTMRSPDGGLDLGTARTTVRSTAVSGLGVVLSVGAGLFLALWWAKNFRTTRRSRQLVSAGSDGSTDDETTA